MARPGPKRRTPAKGASARIAPPSLSVWLAAGVPAALAALLSLPLLGLGYFWDDFLFLTGGIEGGGPAVFLRPGHSGAYYRPLGMGAYFLFLKAVDPTSGFAGHLVNLLGLVAVTILLVGLISDLVNRRAGFIGGLLFAGSCASPSLVAWITCSHDLFAILFTLAALRLRHRGKHALALLAAVVALLWKETAVFALPVLAAWDWLVGRSRSPWCRSAGVYLGIAVVWVTCHPGFRALIGHGFTSGATGYIGVEHPERWLPYGLRYLMTLANLPPVGFEAPWPDDLSIVAWLGSIGVFAALLRLGGRPARDANAEAPADPTRRATLVGLSIGLPLLLAPVLLVRNWAPYLACFPAVGFAIAASPHLARWPKFGLAVFFAVFTLFGVWSRGVAPAGDELVWSESVFKKAARAVTQVRGEFFTVLPEIVPGTEVVVSIGSTGTLGVRSTLVENQALRVWYREPTILTLPTLQRRPTKGTEILARVTSELKVLAIDPSNLNVRTSGPEPNWFLVGRTVRNYAREVVADGDADAGIHAMDMLMPIEPESIRPYNRRLVAMMLIGAGRRDDANRLLAVTAPFPRSESLKFVHRLLAEASSSESLDVAAFEAFGLSERDPEVLRDIIRGMVKEKSLGQAAYWAERLAAVSPGDPEATEVLHRARRAGVRPTRVADVAPERGAAQ